MSEQENQQEERGYRILSSSIQEDGSSTGPERPWKLHTRVEMVELDLDLVTDIPERKKAPSESLNSHVELDITTLSPSAICALEVHTLSQLLRYQARKVSPQQIRALKGSTLSQLPVQALPDSTLRLLSSKQIKALRPCQIGLMDSSQVEVLISLLGRNKQILSKRQLLGIEPQRMADLSDRLLKALSPEVIHLLSPEQIRSLSALQLRLLSKEQILALSPLQFASISVKQVISLKPNYLSSLTHEQVVELVISGSVLAMSNEQLEALPQRLLAKLHILQSPVDSSRNIKCERVRKRIHGRFKSLAKELATLILARKKEQISALLPQLQQDLQRLYEQVEELLHEWGGEHSATYSIRTTARLMHRIAEEERIAILEDLFFILKQLNILQKRMDKMAGTEVH